LKQEQKYVSCVYREKPGKHYKSATGGPRMHTVEALSHTISTRP